MLNNEEIAYGFNKTLLNKTKNETDDEIIQILHRIQYIMRDNSESLWQNMMSLMVLQPVSVSSIILADYMIEYIAIRQLTNVNVTTMPDIEPKSLLPIIKQLYSSDNAINDITERIKYNSMPIHKMITNVSKLEQNLVKDMKQGKAIPLFPPGYICFNYTYALINALITKEIDI